MFKFFKKKEIIPICFGNTICAMADGEMIDITTVSDQIFAKKIMGDSIAFIFKGPNISICAPCSGKLTVLYPTGHAFGITMNNGVEILIHIGIDTVNARGKGFQILNKKQGDMVKVGEEIVKVNFELLRQKYDMSTILIITNSNVKRINFLPLSIVSKGDKVADLT